METQKVPLSNIIHVKDVCPYSDAYNSALPKLRDEWFVVTAGDIIMHDYAVELASKFIREEDNDGVGGFLFGLYDMFMREQWGGLGIFKTSVMGNIQYKDRMDCEICAGRTMVSN